MQIDSINAFALRIPFKETFAHAAAKRSATQTLWITARTRDGARGSGEGCPRDYVTGEDLATAQAFVVAGEREWCVSIHDVATLSAWVDAHRAQIDESPAAWTGVELAMLDLIGQTEGRSLESLLRLPPIAGSFRYSAVLGDADSVAFERRLTAYLAAGFSDFKIKLCGELRRDRSKVRALVAAGVSPHAVRADANNLWSGADAAIDYLAALEFPFSALEEPLRVGDYSGMRLVSCALGARIILDESLCRAEQLDAIDDDIDRWVANVRVSKMGGLIRSLRFAELARSRGLAMIVGAHVGETSVLTRAGLTLANALRGCTIAQEGAFGTRLLEYDVVEPPLMFGKAGLLDATALRVGNGPGLGLAWTGAAVTPLSCLLPTSN